MAGGVRGEGEGEDALGCGVASCKASEAVDAREDTRG